jgi:LacI family transcriptional regulator
MGYRRNALLSILTTQLRLSKKSHYNSVLAFVTSYAKRDAWREGATTVRFFESAKKRADELGYQLEEFWIKEPGITGRRATRILQSRGIKGLVIAPLPHQIGHLSLDWSKFSSATVGFGLAGPHLNQACNAHHHTITLALRHLRHCGYQRIGLAVPPYSNRYVNGSYSAFYLLHENYLPAKNRIPMFCERGPKENYTQENFKIWLKKHQPDAIVGMGPLVHDWSKNLGLCVPRDLGIANLDVLSRESGWSGIDGNHQIVGAAAVDLVVEQLQRNELGIPATPRTIFIEGIWVEGKTVRNRKTKK